MFKALNNDTGEEVIILNFSGDELQSLRQLGWEGQLRCPLCRYEVHVKAGEIRIHHFAHKANDRACPSSGSARLMKGRAVLYKWLQERFKDKGTVKIENMLEDAAIPRPVDVWVECPERTYAFWLFDAGMSVQRCEAFKHAFKARSIMLVPVFLSHLIDRTDGDLAPYVKDIVNLSNTQRRFFHKCRYDSPHTRSRLMEGSLHFLDAEAATLTTFRAMWFVGKHRQYAGKEFNTPLAEVRFTSENLFVHPGEQERWWAWSEQDRKRREEEQRQVKTNRRGYRPPASVPPAWRPPPPMRAVAVLTAIPQSPPTPLNPVSPQINESQEPMAVPPDEEGICVWCGKRTTDWYVLDKATGHCKCNECLRRREAEAKVKTQREG